MALARRRNRILIPICLLLFMYCSMCYFTPYMESKVDAWQPAPREQFVQRWGPSLSVDTDAEMTILLWTDTMIGLAWTDLYGDFNNRKCHSKCKFTFDRSLYNQSDLVVFNAQELDASKEPLPVDIRRSTDKWVIHGTEPVSKIYLNLRKYPNVFNWTSFPRPDSDVRTFYNDIERRTFDKHQDERKIADRIGNFIRREKMVGWVVSNCHADNNRAKYAMELIKYIDVDILGRCSKTHEKIIGSLNGTIQNYKFYLAFENANCQGYITEKLWNSLRLGAIPVVMGDSNAYRRYAPPGSYIDTSRFDSPRDLAAYLHKVASDEAMLNSYFRWVAHYDIVNSYWCELCDNVYHWDGVHQTYTDLYGWYIDDTCPNRSAARIMQFIYEEIKELFYNETPFRRAWWTRIFTE